MEQDTNQQGVIMWLVKSCDEKVEFSQTWKKIINHVVTATFFITSSNSPEIQSIFSSSLFINQMVIPY
jgi:hypothetical protein